MAKKPLIAVTPSPHNVFADIGVAEVEEELAKAQLASRILGAGLGPHPVDHILLNPGDGIR